MYNGDEEGEALSFPNDLQEAGLNYLFSKATKYL